MKRFSQVLLSVAFATSLGCTSADVCPAELPLTPAGDRDAGGWLIQGVESLGVHRYCRRSGDRFVLKLPVERSANGSVVRWQPVAWLEVKLRRGEYTMFAFECGASRSDRGDAIAVVRKVRGEIDVIRAWRIDSATRQFIAVLPNAVTCEPIE